MAAMEVQQGLLGQTHSGPACTELSATNDALNIFAEAEERTQDRFSEPPPPNRSPSGTPTKDLSFADEQQQKSGEDTEIQEPLRETERVWDAAIRAEIPHQPIGLNPQQLGADSTRRKHWEDDVQAQVDEKERQQREVAPWWYRNPHPGEASSLFGDDKIPEGTLFGPEIDPDVALRNWHRHRASTAQELGMPLPPEAEVEERFQALQEDVRRHRAAGEARKHARETNTAPGPESEYVSVVDFFGRPLVGVDHAAPQDPLGGGAEVSPVAPTQDNDHDARSSTNGGADIPVRLGEEMLENDVAGEVVDGGRACVQKDNTKSKEVELPIPSTILPEKRKRGRPKKAQVGVSPPRKSDDNLLRKTKASRVTKKRTLTAKAISLPKRAAKPRNTQSEKSSTPSKVPKLPSRRRTRGSVPQAKHLVASSIKGRKNLEKKVEEKAVIATSSGVPTQKAQRGRPKKTALKLQDVAKPKGVSKKEQPKRPRGRPRKNPPKD
jgi:hypothetical protein